jgi:hypothetical protein
MPFFQFSIFPARKVMAKCLRGPIYGYTRDKNGGSPMESGEELLKYITERFVRYLQTPKEAKRGRKNRQREAWSYRWFGMLPAAAAMWFGQMRQTFAKVRDLRLKNKNLRNQH